ncbi:MAG: hemolysin III family protein [Bacillota bacterium]|nr:hemolysin III family protein [Bacillota bacterium]
MFITQTKVSEKVEQRRLYTLGEEIFNSVTHGIGSIIAIASLVLLIVFAVIYGDGWCLASGIVYGITMVILYTMSTLYHAITPKAAKKVFRIFDHCSIFLLIAGTYTPYALVTLNTSKCSTIFGLNLGWVIFGVVWGLAVIGILFAALQKSKKYIELPLYLLMGWIIVFTLKDLMAALPRGGVVLLIAGGIVYTIGAVFFIMHKWKYMHSIWHIFVLGGSILHFFSILLYVFPVLR